MDKDTSSAPTYQELLDSLAVVEKFLKHVKKELKKAKDAESTAEVPI